MGKGQSNYEMHEMNQGKKRTTQKIPLIDTNARLNNRQFALRGVVTKEKRKLRSIKGIDKRYELKQLPTCNMQFLEYNLMGNNVEGICNVYLEHYPIKVNI